jgi:hypothetical protein
MAEAGVLARSFLAAALGCDDDDDDDDDDNASSSGGGDSDNGGEGRGKQTSGQLGVFHGVKQRPSKQEAEYYREQIYIAEFEIGDDEGFDN